MKRVGVDVGGTFTDLVLWDDSTGERFVHKVPSTVDPADAVITGLAELCALAGITAGQVDLLLHGTTVATNIIVERTGARTGMITTEGFRDVLHIARKKRPLTFSSYQDVPWQASPLVTRADRLTVPERIATRGGHVVIPLDEHALAAALQTLAEHGVESLAICFLGSFASPLHEQRARQLAAAALPGLFICASSEVVPLYREYERFNTCVVNAYVGPKTASYLESLSGALSAMGLRRGLRLMTSSGGVVDSATGQRLPVQLLMSGPAAGLLAGRHAGGTAGASRVITLDVGGTSTDVGVAPTGPLRMKHLLDTTVHDQAVMVPMVDVETIGAGGGSIASVADGILSVGPRSVGATPGPACYGRGGTQATATDAAALLGWIRPDAFFGGRLALDVGAAKTAITERVAEPLGLSAEEAALGVLTVLTHNMASSIRLLSERKGLDPRAFTLVAAGGAGPQFACGVAELTGIGQVLVPPYPGLASAIGLLTTDVRYEQAATVWQPLDALSGPLLEAELAMLTEAARRKLAADGFANAEMSFELAADCRYQGQGYELRVPVPEPPANEAWTRLVSESFHGAHANSYGRRFEGQRVQIVNLRVVGVGLLRHFGAAADQADSGLADTPAAASQRSGHRPGRRETAEAFFRLDGKAQGMPTAIVQRHALRPGDQLNGPAVIEQPDTTIVLPPHWAARADRAGNLLATRTGGQP
ncbi:MAG: hydantoinase/oxoprolinase family protein [Streptosporangiaceae bacterium]